MADNINSKDFIIGTLIGGIVGAGVALFLAPKSGKELRGDLNQGAMQVKDRAYEWKDVAQDKGDDLKEKAYVKGSESKKKAVNQTSKLTKKAFKKTKALKKNQKTKQNKKEGYRPNI